MEYDITVEVDDEFADAVDAEAIENVAAAVLRAENLLEGDLSIYVMSDDELQALNRDWRGVDAPTDVLSFAARDALEGLQAILNAPLDLERALGIALGEIMIAYPYAERQAAHFGNSTADELLLLTVHGVLHLLGWDHDTDEAEAAMWQRQEEILAAFGVTGLSLRRYDE